MTEKLERVQEQIWQLVHSIPKQRVATYGQIAKLAGMPEQSRLVGRVLSRLPRGSKLPWHRVINSQGKITNPNADEQTRRLKGEGIVPINGRVNLRLYQWQP